MGPLLGALGVVLIVVANYDALVTTVAVGSGVRPLTAHVAELLRRLLRRVPGLLAAGGPVITLATVAVWIALLWSGYSLVFSADPAAVTGSRTGDPASGLSRIYFAGYTIFTLGNGGYQPAVGPWELVTTVATLNGLFIVTLAITFLIPVVSAVVDRRQQAALVNGLGETAEQVVASAWDGHSFAFLDQQLPTVAQQILLTAERHLAYPVLHDFRSREPHAASERTLALLDDVVTLLDAGVDASVRLHPATVRVMRSAIDEARRLMPVGPGDAEPPAAPDLEALREHGIPTCPPEQFSAAVASLAERRRHLNALASAAGWGWPNRRAADTV